MITSSTITNPHWALKLALLIEAEPNTLETLMPLS
jgi:hypothetical protein